MIYLNNPDFYIINILLKLCVHLVSPSKIVQMAFDIENRGIGMGFVYLSAVLLSIIRLVT